MHTTPKELARFALYAAVAELADAQDLKSCGTNLPYRFDSGLRHEVVVPQTLIIIGFEALFVLHKKLYKVVQAVFTGLRPVFGPFLLSLVR